MGFTILHGLAAKGSAEGIALELAQDPGRIAARDNLKCTPLHYACDGGHRKAAELLRKFICKDRRRSSLNAREKIGRCGV